LIPQLQRVLSLKPHIITSVTWSPDGRYLASRSNDNGLKVWDGQSGELIHTLEGHSDKVSSVAWSADNSYLASGSWDYTIKLWDIQSGKLIRTIKEGKASVISVVWSADGRYLASGSIPPSRCGIAKVVN
jgi:WD40 repeat protein